MPQMFSNNGATKLAADINTIVTSITVLNGAVFPVPSGGEYFFITVPAVNGNGQESAWEIMKCTARSGNTLTVVRGQESTVAATAVTGASVELRINAAFMNAVDDHVDNVSNPHATTKAQVGLGSVDNTADTAKPVSTAQQTALNLKANLASPTFTGTVSGITAAMVGAPSGSGTSSGTNTGDQTITLTGEVTGSGTGSFAATVPNATVIGKVLTGYASGAGTVAATDTILQAINKLNGNDAAKANIASPTFTGTVGLVGVTETVYNLAGTDIAVANGTIQTKTLAANTTFTESLADGQSVMLGITAGAYSVTWPTTTWAKVGGSGVAPTLTSTGVNWVILWQTGGTLRGSFLGTT